MPQASAAQRREREAAIQLALRAAADVPLEIVRLCTRGLRHAQTVAERSTRAGAPEAELGLALLRTGFNGARANLETRLGNLTDGHYTESILDELARLSEEAAHVAQAAERAVRVPPA